MAAFIKRLFTGRGFGGLRASGVMDGGSGRSEDELSPCCRSMCIPTRGTWLASCNLKELQSVLSHLSFSNSTIVLLVADAADTVAADTAAAGGGDGDGDADWGCSVFVDANGVTILICMHRMKSVFATTYTIIRHRRQSIHPEVDRASWM